MSVLRMLRKCGVCHSASPEWVRTSEAFHAIYDYAESVQERRGSVSPELADQVERLRLAAESYKDVPVDVKQLLHTVPVMITGVIPKGIEERGIRPPWDDCWFEWRDDSDTGMGVHVFRLGERWGVRMYMEHKPPILWLTALLDIDDEGTFHKRGGELLITPAVEEALGMDGAWMSFSMLTTALRMINARNVEIIDNRSPRRFRRRGKPKKRAPLEWKVLQVRHGKRVHRITGLDQPPVPRDTKARLHLVRGHFKTYTEDAPLLGKATGTFWWAHHLRGDSDEGVIQKAYEVDPKTIEHSEEE